MTYYRPGFVTNSSSTGYYFFVPKDKEFTPEFFDQLNITPLHRDDYEDLMRRADSNISDNKTLLEEIEKEEECLEKETEAVTLDNNFWRVMKLGGMTDREIEAIKAVNDGNYSRRYIAVMRKLLELREKEYKIIHARYATDSDDSSALDIEMDNFSIHGEIVEIDGVGGYITLSYH